MPKAKQKRSSPEAPKGLEGVSISSGDDTFVLLSFPLHPAAPPSGLTQSEAAVVELVLAGHRNKAIALARGVSERTVANQLQSAYGKLGVKSRTGLVALLR